MNSTGTTALSTNSDAPIVLLPADGNVYSNFVLMITGTFSGPLYGSISFDGGSTWGNLPAPASAPFAIYLNGGRFGKTSILFKRVAGGTNVTGISAWLQ